MGSAMRKPRIQPGKGSETADSMMEGLTIDIGSGDALVGPCRSTSDRSPSAFV